MKTERWRKLLVSLLACLLLAAALPAPASARGIIDTGREVSLTIQYPCRDITFRIFRIADVSAYGEYSLTGDFRDDPVTLKQPDQAGWRALAETLDAYAARDQRQPLASGKTNGDGQMTFSGLETGMYLVTWQKHTTDGYVYTPEPFLISLPGLDAEDNWIYHVTARPKYDREEVPDQPETVDRKVIKVWKDNGAVSERSESITVQLLQNGKVYDTVTVSGEDRWSYEWEGLNKNDTWQVVENNVTEDYTVTVSKEGTTFVMTNTLTEELPDEPTPEGPLPEVPEENIPDEPVPQGPALPQTGVLWWPVPLLACGGMALFLVGWARRRSEEYNET